uniref:Uncharacterized protein n=1 Tax=Steinernema glaseri TaxID=37863 RepID=A0A1I7ZYF5_9BILA
MRGRLAGQLGGGHPELTYFIACRGKQSRLDVKRFATRAERSWRSVDWGNESDCNPVALRFPTVKLDIASMLHLDIGITCISLLPRTKPPILF